MIKLNKYKARLPWLNDTLKEAIKQKNVLYVKQLRTKNEDDIKFYKSYRNTLTKLLRHAERKHYHDLLEEHKSDLKASWKTLKTVINKGTKGKLPKLFRDGEKEVTNPKDIADRFNKFFTNIGPTLAKSIPKSSSLPLKYLNEKIKESVLFSPVLENEVKNILMLLKNSAGGWDGFDAQIIKQIKDFIISPFTHICNLSITTGVFPRQMKIANIVPIYKSGDNTLFNNYRPVSVLPLFSKILERIVYNRLIEFFNKHSVLYDYQFGFRKLYSTHMALITLIDKLAPFFLGYSHESEKVGDIHCSAGLDACRPAWIWPNNGITMSGPWAIIQVCSTHICMVQCTHLITTGGTPHLYNRGSSMLVNSLHSGENNMELHQ